LIIIIVRFFIKIPRHFEDIFRENGGFNKKSEAFTKITRLLKYIFNRIEAFSKNSRLF
jgi:hypothetical protein